MWPRRWTRLWLSPALFILNWCFRWGSWASPIGAAREATPLGNQSFIGTWLPGERKAGMAPGICWGCLRFGRLACFFHLGQHWLLPATPWWREKWVLGLCGPWGLSYDSVCPPLPSVARAISALFPHHLEILLSCLSSFWTNLNYCNLSNRKPLLLKLGGGPFWTIRFLWVIWVSAVCWDRLCLWGSFKTIHPSFELFRCLLVWHGILTSVPMGSLRAGMAYEAHRETRIFGRALL